MASTNMSGTTTVSASNWNYSDSTDEMRGTKTRLATTHGEETFANMLGMDRAATELVVEREGKKIEVYLHNPNLQFTCNGFSGTRVVVKFDSSPVSRFGCTDAKGGTFGVAFINPGAKFTEKLKHAKKVVIEAEIYQKGDVQQSFNVEGLTI